MGYRVLNSSKFYQHIAASEQEALGRLLMDAWFRHLKGRYIGQQDIEVTNTQQSLTLEHILNGALEIFPVVDINTTRQQINLFDKLNQKDNTNLQSYVKKPPRFITSVDFFTHDLGVRDKIYIDNIERTVSLFDQFSDSVSSEQYNKIHHHIVSFLSAKWTPTSVSLTTYDDALPKNIPHTW
ncbi:hypothetical protein G6F56_011403 [Rhizopus delemar]|nr:hypothetical protein G6F56_011403 [Rhizopus delemar]